MKPMTEKDNDSMATVQMKPEYAPSEVYSTASEAPPAYKRQSNSVKIAKITAFTIIVSSFIIGSFILASAYLQARASCDQVQALDSVLEKELMLETLQQVNKDVPRADALIGKEMPEENDLQNLERDEPTVVKKIELSKESTPVNLQATIKVNEDPISEPETDSSFSDSEETEDLQKIPTKVPLELDLSDLAAALLQNNKKSRMNCVVERKHAEEIVDSPSKTVNLPFGVNLTTDPKKARITGERISIFCESGDEDKEQQPRQPTRDEIEEVEAMRPMFIPFQRVPIPFGQTPNQFPLTHMPQRIMPPMPPMPQQQPPMIRQMPPPFQHLPFVMRPPMPPQVMQAPHPEPLQEHVRIHVQQLPFREIHVADDIPVQIQPVSQPQMPQIQVQRVPLGVALERAGITAEDLRNIQRAAEERISDELRRLAVEEAAESGSDSDSTSSEEDESQTHSNEQMQNQEQQQQQQLQQQQLQQQELQQQQQLLQQQQEQQQQMLQRQQEEEQLTTQQLPMEPRDTMTPPMPDQPQILQIGRAAYGRSLVSPVHIPIPMNQAQADMNQESSEPMRPHYVHPRSVRSTDIFQTEKRVKRCACDCNC